MSKEKEIVNYSDIAPQLKPLFENVERIELGSVLNKEIVIKEFGALPSTVSDGREFVVILADVDGSEKSFSCGEIVLKQLREVEDKLPIKAKIVKPEGKRYYTLE